MPAQPTRAFLEWNRRTSPISAMSCGSKVGPTPNSYITTGNSGSVDARSSISRLSAAKADEVTAGGEVDLKGLGWAEIVVVLTAPLQVHGDKSPLCKAVNALAMSEIHHEIHPFLTAVHPGRT